MQPKELRTWLHLLDSVGRAAARRLLARHGDAEAVLNAGQAGWTGLVTADEAQRLRHGPPKLEQTWHRTQAWLEASDTHSVLLLGDPDYPPSLLHTADPPLMLYLDGRRELLGRRAIAVVGSRHPTPQGEDNARMFAAGLGQAGFCVVSGLAMGIDGAAHEASLNTAGGTVAVLGTGLDQVYPLAHEALARHISRRGLLVSEYFIGTPPLAPNFPQRNRIIAGLAEGCLVVEAAMKSGSLITARMASEAGREVFAIPGSIHAPQSRGCHHLLKQGACLVQTLEDLLSELPPTDRPNAQTEHPASPTHPSGTTPRPASATAVPGPGPLTAPANDAVGKPAKDAGGQPADPADTANPTHPVLRALGHDPISLEQLSQRTGWSVNELAAVLLDLELEGEVARLPGARFQRRVRA
ncbi:DNA protecting protein DprA [Roseateles sp. YR242]|uniref:DNA-processing protein DprA n=1 Tax=Roseateles sp. YR242 TaxID=1855305 RepID=UPI0008CE24D1|nr:DNA-processing protein DprA [Roseateles sp. YR242]SEL50360.1 DNA protecting protein DprA [Roseateles sp. YR242]